MTTSMSSQYEIDLQNGKRILDTIGLADRIYNVLYDYLHSSNKSPDFRTIVWDLFHIYRRCNFYTDDYIVTRMPEIIYELAIEIYWKARIFQNKHSEKKEKDTIIALNYMKALGISYKKNNQQKEKSIIAKTQEFSKAKSTFLDEYNSPATYKNGKLKSSQKYKEYSQILHAALIREDSPLEMSEMDRFFFTMNHSKGFFSQKKINAAKTYTFFHALLSEYKELHSTDVENDLDSELSAFVLEKMVNSISFSKCIYSYLKNDYLKDRISLEIRPLSLFCKLYDSHYISLIDFISKKYQTQMGEYFDRNKGELVRGNSYFEFQVYNSFILPMLYQICLITLHEQSKGNIDLIMQQTKEYILDSFNAPYKYRNKFLNTMNEINFLHMELSKDNTKTSKLKKLFFLPPIKKINFHISSMNCYIILSI